MICADTSSFIAYWEGDPGSDAGFVDRALVDGNLRLAFVTVTELLSDPALSPRLERLVMSVPRLEISAGYWERAGRLQAKLSSHGYRHKLADSLIAQSCLDHDLPLITRDRDFVAFEKLAGLKLLTGGARVQ